MSTHRTPLEVAEALIGKPEEIGRIVGTHPKRPYGWRHASDGRDAGDIPSARHMRALLAHSETHGLGLTADHLVRGATEDEVQAILASLGTLAVPRFASRRRPPQLEAAE